MNFQIFFFASLSFNFLLEFVDFDFWRPFFPIKRFGVLNFGNFHMRMIMRLRWIFLKFHFTFFPNQLKIVDILLKFFHDPIHFLRILLFLPFEYTLLINFIERLFAIRTLFWFVEVSQLTLCELWNVFSQLFSLLFFQNRLFIWFLFVCDRLLFICDAFFWNWDSLKLIFCLFAINSWMRLFHFVHWGRFYLFVENRFILFRIWKISLKLCFWLI